MPNHVTNKVTLHCSEERFKEIFNAIKRDEKEDGIDCIDFEKIIPMPENIFRGSLGQEEREKYGTLNWYDWSIDNWGTKWNAYYPQEPEGTTFAFCTAWSTPEPVMKALAEKFKVDVEVNYADEDLGNNCGMYRYDENGALVAEYCPENYEEGLKFACEVCDFNYEDIKAEYDEWNKEPEEPVQIRVIAEETKSAAEEVEEDDDDEEEDEEDEEDDD